MAHQLVPVRVPEALLQRIAKLVDVLGQDPKLAAYGKVTLSSVVRLALEHGADAMETEFGAGTTTPTMPERRRRSPAANAQLVVVRMPPPLLLRLQRLVAAVAEHPLWQGLAPPAFSEILRMALMSGLRTLEVEFLTPGERPHPLAGLMHAPVPGKPLDD